MVENYLGIAVASLRRGYDVLLDDGPGQGRLLVDEGLALCHDWDTSSRRGRCRSSRSTSSTEGHRLPAVEPRRLHGARVAALSTALPRSSADPGQLDVGGKFTVLLSMVGSSADAIAKLPAIDPADEKKVMSLIDGDRGCTGRSCAAASGRTADPPVVVPRQGPEVEARPRPGTDPLSDRGHRR